MSKTANPTRRDAGKGWTLRDECAMRACEMLLRVHGTVYEAQDEPVEGVIWKAYQYADAFLEARAAVRPTACRTLFCTCMGFESQDNTNEFATSGVSLSDFVP